MPSSLMSISTGQASMIDLIIFPLGDDFVILSGTLKASMRGAVGARSPVGYAFALMSRMRKCAVCAFSKAMRMMSRVMPSFDVHLHGGDAFAGAGAPKSMSPRWSSGPMMSVRITYLCHPDQTVGNSATGALMGTPAAIIACSRCILSSDENRLIQCQPRSVSCMEKPRGPAKRLSGRVQPGFRAPVRGVQRDPFCQLRPR